MVKREDLYPGVRVRIISEWQDPHTENCEGLMDHWLGQIMTVKDVGNGYGGIRMYEDDDECHGGGTAMAAYGCMRTTTSALAADGAGAHG